MEGGWLLGICGDNFHGMNSLDIKSCLSIQKIATIPVSLKYFGHLLNSSKHIENAIWVTKNSIAMYKLQRTLHPGEIRTQNLLFRWQRQWPLHTSRRQGNTAFLFMKSHDLCQLSHSTEQRCDLLLCTLMGIEPRPFVPVADMMPTCHATMLDQFVVPIIKYSSRGLL
jgi:hypothetical protein